MKHAKSLTLERQEKPSLVITKKLNLASIVFMTMITTNNSGDRLSIGSSTARITYSVTVLAILLAGCSGARTLPQSLPIGDRQITQAAAINIDTLQGRWKIMAFNGTDLQDTGDRQRRPSVSFIGATYGADSGCNALSGIATLNGTRFYTMPGPQTQIGCQGTLSKQEAILEALLRAAPQIAIDEHGVMMMSGGGHRIKLQRDSGAAFGVAKPAIVPVKPDTQFQIDAVDGALVRSSDTNEKLSLTFGSSKWRAQSACSTLAGEWRQQGATLKMDQIVLAKRRCKVEDEVIDQAIHTVLASSPTFTTGPNGEIVLAGAGHWISGIRTDNM